MKLRPGICRCRGRGEVAGALLRVGGGGAAGGAFAQSDVDTPEQADAGVTASAAAATVGAVKPVSQINF